MKLVRIPAMFGGATIAGLAYFQYQATRTFYMRQADHKEPNANVIYRSRKLCNGYL